MPHRIEFRIVSATSEDFEHRANELNRIDKVCPGWFSSKYCIYPQTIVINLLRRCRLRKIQILSHQFMIASKIEFLIGDIDEISSRNLDYNNITFTKLGYVSMSDNLKTDFKSRELKSVFFDAIGTYLKLVLHNNYHNSYNINHQVGIMALNLIGDYMTETFDEESSFQVPDTSSDDYISPLEDLAFVICQDSEVACIIKKLNIEKESAVKKEDFDKAKNYRDAIIELQKVAQKLGKLELDKQHAINAENYELAKIKKEQLYQYREAVFKNIRLNELLPETEINQANGQDDWSSDESVSTLNSSIFRSKQPRKPTPRLHLTSLDEIYEDSLIFNAPKKVFEPPKTKDEAIVRKDRQNFEENSFDWQVEDKDRMRLVQVKNDKNFFQDPDERPLPALHAKRDDQTASLLLDNEKIEELDNQSIDQSIQLTQKIAPDEISVEITEHIGEEDSLSEKNLRIASVAIDVVGLPLVREFYSKNWSIREKGLEALVKRMNSDSLSMPDALNGTENTFSDPREEIRASLFLLLKALKDQVFVVFHRACDLIHELIVVFGEKHNLPKSEILHSLDRILPLLLHRNGDPAPRIREVAKNQIISMSKWPILQHSQVFWNEIQKPFGPTTLDRSGLSRVEILAQLYTNQSLSNNSSSNSFGHTLPQLARFCATGLQHRNGDVREAVENLLISIFQSTSNEGRLILRAALPTDDIKTRKQPLYKRLYGKFDQIEGINVSGRLLQPDMQSLLNAKRSSVVNQANLSQQNLRHTGINHGSQRNVGSGIASRRNFSSNIKKKNASIAEQTDDRIAAAISSNTNLSIATEADILLGLEKTCIFCGERNESFTEEALDLHYWRNCVMLKRCSNCKQVVEISGYTDHLLNECKSGAIAFERCPRCSEAILKGDFNAHIMASTCKPCSNPAYRCPLCHTDLPITQGNQVSEDIWRAHLLGNSTGSNVSWHGCPHNPRRPHTQRASLKPGSSILLSRPAQNNLKSGKAAKI